MKRDYEKRIKKGYQEIDFCLDVVPSPIITISEGKNANKKVFITTQYLEMAETSNIMLGKNKYQTVLENTEYLSLKEVKKAIKSLLTFENGEEIYTRDTKERIAPEEVTERIIQNLKSRGELLIGTKNKKIRNQNTAKIFVKGMNQTDFIKKGILMLGNKGIELPCGEYINRDALEESLYDFIILKPKRKPLLKRKKSKKKWHLWPMALAGTMIASMGFNAPHSKKIEEEKNKSSNFQEQVIEYTKEVPILENEEQMKERVLSQIEIGKSIDVKSGTTYYAASDYQYGGDNKKGMIGAKIRPETEYTVSEFSIINEGVIQKTETQIGQNLYETIQDCETEYAPNNENTDYMLHLSSPETGWINVNEIIDLENEQPKILETQLITEKEYLKELKIKLLKYKQEQNINWNLNQREKKKGFLIGALGVLTSIALNTKTNTKKLLRKKKES